MTSERYDLIVVGAGIIGLAHAFHARERGLSVAVIEQNDRVLGASIRNFGHACVTAQSGSALDYARSGREHWIRLADEAGFGLRASGTWCVARSDDELAVMAEFARARGAEQVRLLDREAFLEQVPVAAAVGGMHLPDDLQVDPRAAAPAIAAWLEHRRGVDFHWRTAVLGIEPGRVRTSRSTLATEQVVVAVNHDVDRLFPGLGGDLLRCRLHMLRATVRLPRPLPGPLFTGWSLLRYAGFTGTEALRARLESEYPAEVAADLHLMVTPQADGTLIVGDTHIREVSESPFQSEHGFEMLLGHARELFGSDDIDVVERWQGVYSSAPGREFLIAEPAPGVHVVTVTTGIGMTTGLGLAASVLDRIAPVSPNS
ncbi:TIGR03364 family FAD-dependent oxidoreductase [Nocardia asteroides]|uniref:TIGR03364 family FAD-dependent oxidoreductase n=1 Tax=Nocardia asteroides TaxID=1824 RepID=UPI001E378CD0|nr:TIGR03364 family FAD-dependent oxidoreductase [Nocardia asteroides]UGT62579.1 TIGR03364 family FAD-dependent oxidoreductase [Nocardia asteroides]